MLIGYEWERGFLVPAKQAKLGVHYCCPYCGQPLRLKRGSKRATHFAHQQTCTWSAKGESQEHLAGKQVLAQVFQDQGWQVTLEEPLFMLQQRADLTLRRGLSQVIVEYQCANLSTEEVQRRQAGYRAAGFAAFWVLGNRYQKLTANRLCCFLSHEDQHFVTYHLIRTSKKLVQRRQPLIAFEPLRIKSRPALLKELNQIQQSLMRQLPEMKQIQSQLYQQGYHAALLPWMCHLPYKTIGMRKPAWYLAAQILIQLKSGPCSTQNLVTLLDIDANWYAFGLLERRLWISEPWLKYVLTLWQQLALVKRIANENWTLTGRGNQYQHLTKKQIDLQQNYVQWRRQVVEY